MKTYTRLFICLAVLALYLIGLIDTGGEKALAQARAGHFDGIPTPFAQLWSSVDVQGIVITPTVSLCYLPVTTQSLILGTAYYVDNVTGSDANPGTLTQPWQSVAKVNAAQFEPHDRVLFRRNGTWPELGLVRQAGTSSAPVTFGAYGWGANPSIAGLRVMHGQHLVFQDLTFERSPDAGIFIGGKSEHVTVARCLIRDNVSYGISIWAPGQSNFLIVDSAIRDNGSTSGTSSGVFAHADNVEVARNVITNNGYGDANWGFSHGIYIDESTTGARIYDNEVFGNVRGHGIAVKSSSEIFRNFVHDNDIAGILVSEYVNEPVTGVITVVVHTNILARNAFGVAHYGESGAVNLYVYHNAFYHNNSSWGGDIYVEADLATLAIIDNIVHSMNGENAYELVAQHAARIEHNCVYHPGSPVIRHADALYSWSQWQASGYDAGSIAEDPGFVDPAHDNFELSAGSPCIDAGIDVGVQQDFADRPRPQGAGFDMGPYEAASGQTPLPGSTASPMPGRAP